MLSTKLLLDFHAQYSLSWRIAMNQFWFCSVCFLNFPNLAFFWILRFIVCNRRYSRSFAKYARSLNTCLNSTLLESSKFSFPFDQLSVKTFLMFEFCRSKIDQASIFCDNIVMNDQTQLAFFVGEKHISYKCLFFAWTRPFRRSVTLNFYYFYCITKAG